MSTVSDGQLKHSLNAVDTLNMEKVYRRSQKLRLLGRRIKGFSMYKYGLPYKNAAGHIFARDVDLVERMLDVVKNCPELHVVTCLNNGWTVNRYESENAATHYLYTGNADPDLEFNDESSAEDYTEEEIAAFEKRNREPCHAELSPLEIAALNFAVHAAIYGDRDK